MSTSKTPIHPALVLFKKLFDEAAVDCENNPENPTHYVPRSVFIDRVHAAGIAAPTNIMEFMLWEQGIGMREFAHKVFAAHHRARGTDFTPMEKGAWRLYLHEKRHGMALEVA